ncbi:MAG: PTS sugar transporter subunit IIA [Pseudomonadota bacterium]
MDMSTILKPEAVRVLSGVSSKKRLFHELGGLVDAAYRVDSSDAIDALLERESLGPTGVGHGVALPHARLTSVDRVLGAMVLLEKPVNFDSVDRQPVDLVFALFAPEDAGVDHLKALALISRTLKEADTCSKLRSNRNPATLHTIMTEALPVKAA